MALRWRSCALNSFRIWTAWLKTAPLHLRTLFLSALSECIYRIYGTEAARRKSNGKWMFLWIGIHPNRLLDYLWIIAWNWPGFQLGRFSIWIFLHIFHVFFVLSLIMSLELMTFFDLITNSSERSKKVSICAKTWNRNLHFGFTV